MRIISALICAGVLGLTSAAALADGVVYDCKPNSEGGCACNEEPLHLCPEDMAAPPRDFSPGPRDFSQPPDGGLDARNLRRRRKAAGGRGLILLSGASALVVFALRRRYKTMRPTPAESALAASETRSDS